MQRMIGLLAVLLTALSCSERQADVAEGTGDRLQAFTGATLWDGHQDDPVQDAVLLVQNGRVLKVGASGDVEIPPDAERIDLVGKTIIPGLINSHGHVGLARGLETGPEVNTRENVLDQLGLYARYGVTTVLSLGGDGPASFEVRDEQERPGLGRARLFLAGPVLEPETPEEARQLVDEAVERRADWIKIRVDDNLGTTPKMPVDVFEAVIDQSHQRGMRVAAHIYYLDDAKALLRAGVDFIAHSVRDQPVDEELIGLLKQRNVCLCPTLTRELSTFVYATVPDFFEDPFFLREADGGVLEQLKSPQRQQQIRESRAARLYRQALGQARSNLKALSDAGVRIAFGTDSGPPARFQGYFEHLELAMMADSGLSAQQVLYSATGQAAACLGMTEVGVLEPGRWADFVVLDGNPLRDVQEARKIHSIWIGGGEVSR